MTKIDFLKSTDREFKQVMMKTRLQKKFATYFTSEKLENNMNGIRMALKGIHLNHNSFSYSKNLMSMK